MPADQPAVRRDRDELGRARNSRPRDALGRPLPYGSPHVERQPEGIERSAEQSVDEAQRLLDRGLPFHAHEVFEDAWKFSDGPDRLLWKGLAQLAVGITHLARGNRRGAETLLRRAATALEPFVGAPPFRLDVAGLVTWARQTATAVTQGGDLEELFGRAITLAPRTTARDGERWPR